MERTMLRRRHGVIATLVLLLAGAAPCPTARAQTADPALEIVGGGFIFNYRLGRAHYGVVVKPRRALPEGAILEALFENPAGGEPFSVRQPAPGGARRVTLRSPDLTGVAAGRDYTILLRVREGTTDRILDEQTKILRSDLDQSVLPEKPPFIGPGYEPNPEYDPGNAR